MEFQESIKPLQFNFCEDINAKQVLHLNWNAPQVICRCKKKAAPIRTSNNLSLSHTAFSYCVMNFRFLTWLLRIILWGTMPTHFQNTIVRKPYFASHV